VLFLFINHITYLCISSQIKPSYICRLEVSNSQYAPFATKRVLRDLVASWFAESCIF